MRALWLIYLTAGIVLLAQVAAGLVTLTRWQTVCFFGPAFFAVWQYSNSYRKYRI